MALGFWQQDKINSNKMQMSTYLVMFSFTSSSLGYKNTATYDHGCFIGMTSMLEDSTDKQKIKNQYIIFWQFTVLLFVSTNAINMQLLDEEDDTDGHLIISALSSLPDHFRLVDGVKQLEDSKTLADYNVFKEFTLRRLLRLGGRAPNQGNR
ncbi:unnamed protein product [Musa hybrid cultivar]